MIQRIQEANLAPVRAKALAAVVLALSRAGYVDEARSPLAALQKLATGVLYPQVMADIAQVQAASGDIVGALATLAQTERGDHNPFLLSRLVDEVCRLNDFAAEIDNPFHDSALEHIAAGQAKTGDISAAMVTAWRIMDLSDRAAAMLELLRAAKKS
jgi:hypothetical protein